MLLMGALLNPPLRGWLNDYAGLSSTDAQETTTHPTKSVKTVIAIYCRVILIYLKKLGGDSWVNQG